MSILQWRMVMKVGDIVRILTHDHAMGLLGIIESFENKSGLWIIKLWNSPLKNKNKPLRLSLSESDFKVIEYEP